MICSQCKGTGKPNNNKVDYEKRYFYIPPKQCDKCKGTGKLDWIEAVVGKKPELILDSIVSGSATKNYVDCNTSVNLKYDLDQEIKQEIIDEVAEKMKKHIDESILERMAEFAKGGKI